MSPTLKALNFPRGYPKKTPLLAKFVNILQSQTFIQRILVFYLFEMVTIGSLYFSFPITSKLIIWSAIEVFMLLFAGVGLILTQLKPKEILKFRQTFDFILTASICCFFLTKVELALNLQMTEEFGSLVLGTTILIAIILAEYLEIRLRDKLALLLFCFGYILIRILVRQEQNTFLILQLLSVAFSCCLFVQSKSQTHTKDSPENSDILQPNGLLERTFRCIPANFYLLDSNLQVLFKNSFTGDNPALNKVFEKYKEIPTNDQSKLDVFKSMRNLEIGDEDEEDELAQNFFLPICFDGTTPMDETIADIFDDKNGSARSARRLITLTNRLRSSVRTEQFTATATLTARTRNSRKFKNPLQNYNGLQVLDIIAKNIKRFHEFYANSYLTIHSKIGDMPSYHSLNTFKKSLFSDRRESSEANQMIEIKIIPVQINQEDAILVMISEKADSKPEVSTQNIKKYKVNLLASFSHELRTPLNGNLNFLEAALQRKDVSFELKRDYLLPAITSAKLLFYLINNILDYSQFSLNKMYLSVKNFKVKSLLVEVIELFTIQATKKKLKITLDIPEDFEITSDSTRLSQVLVSLMSNALKFTYEGGIQIGAYPIDMYGKSFEFFVKDTGIGMSKKERKTVRRLLSGKASDKIGDIAVGYSLGLTTAGKLALSLGPERSKGIILESEQKGTKFSFLVESKALAKDQKSLIDFSVSEVDRGALSEASGDKAKNFIARSKTLFHEEKRNSDFNPPKLKRNVSSHNLFRRSIPSPDSQGNLLTAPEEGIPERVDQYSMLGSMMKLKSKNSQTNEISKLMMKKLTSFVSEIRDLDQCRCNQILIVDDDSFNVMAAERLFGSFKLDCVSAFHGRQAIEVIESKTKCSESCQLFRFIIMDCNMPILDGYETTKYLKTKEANNELPFIPIIGCTAFVTHFDANKCFNSGMDDYVTKPLSKDKINRILEKWNKVRTSGHR